MSRKHVIHSLVSVAPLVCAVTIAAMTTARIAASQLAARPNRPFHLFKIDGLPAESFARSIAGCGDVDRDGAPDWIVGAPFSSENGVQSGRALVVSGRTGLTIFEVKGSAFEQLGWSVCGVGDVDRDGHGDFAIASLVTGVVRVWSGRTRSVLTVLTGDAAEERVGWSIAGVGDCDGDGTPDIAYSSLTGSGTYIGKVRVVSAKDGRSLWSIGDTTATGLGDVVVSAGDLDRDGYADVLVRSMADASGNGNRPLVVLRSGKTGHAIHTWTGGDSSFGASVANCGDVDRDGADDIVIGSPRGGASFEGRVTVQSGKSGKALWSATGTAAFEEFGAAVAAAGDVDRDGIPDVVVGAPGHDESKYLDVGLARVLSGVDGRVIETFLGRRTKGAFGASIASLGDVNGDGMSDFVVGAPTDGSSYRDAEGYIGARAQVLSPKRLSLVTDCHWVDANDRWRTMDLDAGTANAGKVWLLLGSLTSTGPTKLPWFDLPLTFDAYTSLLLASPNTVLPSVGILDAAGRASSDVFHPLWPSTAYHAFVVLDFQSVTICCPSVAVPTSVRVP
ncbi:MAG: VCBS repeat-containing protein [Planctomycetes bacterium]|nr:VCBS repeat-containing protein [Planctomycetota bacterium]MCB9892683.1 VCBS repeat-containing protein [Planctomycetota bacterium]MCB9919090.1 VCBS repeat-containing protein [Planctomycetota bacterium]